MISKSGMSGLTIVFLNLTLASCSLSLDLRVGNTPDTPGRKDFAPPPPRESAKADESGRTPAKGGVLGD